MTGTRVLVAVLGLWGCVPVPHRVAVRREASGRLAACLGLWGPRASTAYQKQVCLEENRSFCLEKGLEAGCGIDGLWGR